jgi:multicomponent K+:H+ antiporter subunit F
MILTYALHLSTGLFGVALLLNIWRLFTAPTLTDRLLVIDTVAINMIAIVILFGTISGTSLYFEAAMLLAMTGFVATVAYCKYLLRGSIIE